MERSSSNHVGSHTVGESNGANATFGGLGLPGWFTLSLDQFFNSATGFIDQGLGGAEKFNILEVLLNEGCDGNANGEGESGGGTLPSQSL